uniref:Uncharacterized protein n=1 Tax=Physcomitrium patens TaxID=3218 RepID=A0A2K1KTL0_PHYPA|nr:hypothetical protein PHYPA_004118 [Physcomitrium patens]
MTKFLDIQMLQISKDILLYQINYIVSILKKYFIFESFLTCVQVLNSIKLS